MIWINFLHLYQPANTDPYIVEEATEKSYKWLVKILEDNPEINFTFNITGCLVLRWRELGYFSLIKKIKELVEKGQIELTGSASHHPLLPLIPAEEARAQIEENTEILKDNFGQNLKLRGFFLPEMAYGRDTAKIVKECGFEWIILDELAYNGTLRKSPQAGKVCEDIDSGLKAIFRSRELSSDYVPRCILSELEEGEKNKVVVTATDGELYGLRHVDKKGEFNELLDKKGFSAPTISDYIDEQQGLENKRLTACSWESTEKELKGGTPYFLWYNRKNKIHCYLWKLARLAYNISIKYNRDNNHQWTRWHLKRGLASCAFWWASAKDFSHIFGPYAWNPDEIERGVNELIRSVRSVENKKSAKEKVRAEKLYIKIKKMIWKHHWTYYWHKQQ
jgi:hypothetical protein